MSTSDCAAGIEIARLSCGGHGYMSCSNLPGTYGLVTAACTYEGENTVLFLQTAKYLVKAWQHAKDEKEVKLTVQYLNDYVNKKTNVKINRNVDNLILALQHIAAR